MASPAVGVQRFADPLLWTLAFWPCLTKLKSTSAEWHSFWKLHSRADSLVSPRFWSHLPSSQHSLYVPRKVASVLMPCSALRPQLCSCMEPCDAFDDLCISSSSPFT